MAVHGHDSSAGLQRKSVTILHLSDLQFGRNHRFAGVDLGGLPNPYDTLLARLWDDLQRLRKDHSLQPDLVIVTGDLAERGMHDELRAACEFLQRLTDEDHLGLVRQRVAIVPGNHDTNRDLCLAYFAMCRAAARSRSRPGGRNGKPTRRCSASSTEASLACASHLSSRGRFSRCRTLGSS